MNELLREASLVRLGFRFGVNGPHAARTMMFDDLRQLMAHTLPTAARPDYGSAVTGGNVLGKRTRSARELAWRHLATLYGFDPENPIFRAFRRLWPLQETAQPMLALAVALARDPLLRASQSFILQQSLGAAVPREALEAVLADACPGRFSAASLKSFAQNVAGTWTAAGLLNGRVRKTRARVQPQPEAVAMLLFLGYLKGRSGQRLFSSGWMDLLDSSPDELEALAQSASHKGLLVFLNAGGIKEVRFPDYLSAEEEQIRQELSHVV